MARLLDVGLFGRGTLWAVELDSNLPPRCEARIATTLVELDKESLRREDFAFAETATPPTLDHFRSRLQSGRRCFALIADGTIATYGWVSYGAERVDEMDRTFKFAADDAYIWDCWTRPALRGQRCYSTLLSECIYRLQSEGTQRVWIGADLNNIPSIKGFANAGFHRVVDLILYRWGRITLAYTRPASSASPLLVRAARAATTASHERRFGPIAIGYTP